MDAAVVAAVADAAASVCVSVPGDDACNASPAYGVF